MRFRKKKNFVETFFFFFCAKISYGKRFGKSIFSGKYLLVANSFKKDPKNESKIQHAKTLVETLGNGLVIENVGNVKNEEIHFVLLGNESNNEELTTLKKMFGDSEDVQFVKWNEFLELIPSLKDFQEQRYAPSANKDLKRKCEDVEDSNKKKKLN